MKLTDDAVDAVLREAVEAGDVPAVVAAVTDKDGEVYRAAVGLAQTSASRNVEIDSVFRIASMTKVVTSLAVMMLLDEGKVELDAPLASYLPSYRQPGVLAAFDDRSGAFTTRGCAQAITPRHLLTHTGGYGYWFLDRPLRALTTGAPELFDPPFLMTPPGEKFAYSIGTDVLGQIVEPVSGLRLDDFFRERIFAPLDMPDTGFELPADPGRLVAAHARAEDSFVERISERTGNAPRGGGGLYSTASDYLKLLRLFLNGGRIGGVRLLERATIESMSQNQIGALDAAPQKTAEPEYSNDFIFMDGTQRFGFGFMIETRDRQGGRRVGSYSWGGILNTYFWVDPRAGIAAVILMQVSPFADPACVELYRKFESAVYGA